MAAIDGVLSHRAGARRHSDHQPQHLRRRASTDSRLVRQAGQPGHRRRDLRRLRRRRFSKCWERTEKKHADRFAAGRQAYVYLESPCNPHGYVLDLPDICRAAHAAGLRVMLDATVGTPFLVQPLQRDDPAERPDFVIHSYTKDLSGTGSSDRRRGDRPQRRHVHPQGRHGRRQRVERDDVLERVLRERGVPQRRRRLRSDSRHAHARSADAAQVHQHADPGAVLRRASADQRALQRAADDDQNSRAARAARVSRLAGAAVHDRHATACRARRFQRFFDSPRADVRPHDQPRAVEHDRQLPGAHDAFRT